MRRTAAGFSSAAGKWTGTGPGSWRKKLSFVPQVHERTFPYTVEQIVLMGRNAYGSSFSGPREEDRRIVEEVLKRTGIAHLAQRPYTQISGGEMQLVLLARALVQNTSVVIMDEPSAHLDFRNELIFLENAARLIREESTSVLMATHSTRDLVFSNGWESMSVCWLSAAGRCALRGRLRKC